eukprot:353615-Chlamydomonas_euryale.AAC.8
MLGGGHRRGLPGLIVTFGNASSCARRWLSSGGRGVDDSIRWVFLGAPGVGKGTYASRASKHFGVAHIATGDLIRAEMKAGSALGTKVLACEPCGHPCSRAVSFASRTAPCKALKGFGDGS